MFGGEAGGGAGEVIDVAVGAGAGAGGTWDVRLPPETPEDEPESERVAEESSKLLEVPEGEVPGAGGVVSTRGIVGAI